MKGSSRDIELPSKILSFPYVPLSFFKQALIIASLVCKERNHVQQRSVSNAALMSLRHCLRLSLAGYKQLTFLVR
jgi:hypothetical protein